MTKKRITILTYNIHKGFSSGNRHFVLNQMRSALVAADVDVLLLQETQGEHLQHEKQVHDWPDCAQFEFLGRGTWQHCVYAENATYSAGHHGNAILSKFPVLNWENINVSPYRWASRSLLHGELSVPGSDTALHVICIHLGLLGTERQRQIDLLCDRIDSHVPHDAPLIVAGDFNDWTGEAERRLYKRLDLQEAYRCMHGHRARTYPSWLPVLPMDRIYYRGLAALSCERLIHAPWSRLSDHAPLTAAFKL